MLSAYRDTINQEVANLEPGTTFIVKGLLKEIWNSIPKGDRIAIGKEFKCAVQDGAFPLVQWARLRPDNSNEYRRLPANRDQG